MALFNKGETITMDVNDFGQTLPVYITDINIDPSDKVIFEVKKNTDSSPIIRKEYENSIISNNEFDFFISFTESESKMLNVGNYIYYIRLVRGNELVNTLISGSPFIVKNSD